MKKRMVSAFTCAALTLSLSACAGKSSSSDAGSESQSSQEAATTTAPVVTLAPEKTTVINPEPVTYESLGVDSKKKDSFKEKMTKAHTLPIINVTTAPEDEIVSMLRQEFEGYANGDDKDKRRFRRRQGKGQFQCVLR